MLLVVADLYLYEFCLLLMSAFSSSFSVVSSLIFCLKNFCGTPGNNLSGNRAIEVRFYAFGFLIPCFGGSKLSHIVAILVTVGIFAFVIVAILSLMEYRIACCMVTSLSISPESVFALIIAKTIP